MTALMTKLSSLLEILQLPGGLSAKIRIPAFHQGLWQQCQILAALGVRPRSVLDVGANVGQFALAAAHILKPERILAVEPIPEIFEKLKRLPMPSGVAFEALCLALGEAAGQAKFHLMSQADSSSLLPIGALHQALYPEVRDKGDISVKVETLEDFLSRHPSPQPCLLKLDVQGAELQVLRGGGNFENKFRWVFLETSSEPFYEGSAVFWEVDRFLTSRGYQWVGPVAIHYPSKIRPASSLQFDALYSYCD